MKKLVSAILATAILTVSLAGCVKNTVTELVKPDISKPYSMLSAQKYLTEEDYMQKVITSDGEYLLAFYGRIEGEPEDQNRIIYINKFNEIEKEIRIPENVDLKLPDFYYTENYILMMTRQYNGVDKNFEMHGIAALDTDGNLLSAHPSRDPNIFIDVDTFSRFNRLTFNWCEKDSETFILSTHFGIYEYKPKDDKLTQILELGDVIENYDFETAVADHSYLDIFSDNFGFSFVFWSDELGLIFAVTDDFTQERYYTLYSYKDGKINQITDKNSGQCGLYIPFYNTESDSLVRLDPESKKYLINEEKYKEYDSVVRIYVSNDYAHECGWEPLVLGWNTSALKTTVYYYDSITNQHYKVDVTTSDASFGGAFYDSPWSACGKYVYFSSIGAVENTSYRLNVTTGKGDFVYGGVADMSLCPGYRISEEDVYFEETADMMVRLFVYEDYIL